MLPNRRSAGAQLIALAAATALVTAAGVTAFPEVVPVTLHVLPETLAGSASPMEEPMVPQAVAVDAAPPAQTSTVYANASVNGATAGGGQEPPPPPEPAGPAPKRGGDLVPWNPSGDAAAVIRLTNEKRRAAGCGDVVPEARLAKAAHAHVQDMHDNHYFSHQSRDGRRFEHRVRAAGYPRPGAENIAQGQTSPDQVIREWMNSPSHRSAMLTCSFIAIGVARVGDYWAQEYGK